jgi:hypothetical protein
MQLKLAPQLVQICCCTIAGWQIAIGVAIASSLPPITDIPEEVLRAEIITEARSPIDGKPLSAAEFAELIINVEQQLSREDAIAATNSPQIKELLFLVRLRGFLKSVGIPIR